MKFLMMTTFIPRKLSFFEISPLYIIKNYTYGFLAKLLTNWSHSNLVIVIITVTVAVSVGIIIIIIVVVVVVMLCCI